MVKWSQLYSRLSLVISEDLLKSFCIFVSWGIIECNCLLFGPKREEVAGGWRRLHDEELHNLYDSQNMIRVIKSWRMRWAGLVAHMEEMRNMYKILFRKT
jgi:hypothetical protein